MNPVVKLALFVVLLIAMVGGGAVLGAVTHPDGDPAPEHVHSSP